MSLAAATTIPALGSDGTAAGERRGVGGRRRNVAEERVVDVHGYRCTDGLQTLVDLSATLDDDRWEQALESALHRGTVRVADLRASLPALGRARTRGTSRIRRVLDARPSGAPPTESLLETRMVQLARSVESLDTPVRQLVIERDSRFVARLDLAWPDLGLFVELDGQHHKDQPVYDARRETAVVAATGWLCGRFTWTEVVHLPTATRRRLGDLARQARDRPVVRPVIPAS